VSFLSYDSSRDNSFLIFHDLKYQTLKDRVNMVGIFLTCFSAD